MTKFIFLIGIESEGTRVSSLAIKSKGAPDLISVVGVLPHNYMFKPLTALDRDMLVNFLNELEYDS